MLMSPDCRYHARPAVHIQYRKKDRELQYLHCSYANIPERETIDLYDKHGSIEGGRCLNVASGVKRSQGQKPKKAVDPLDQY